MGTKEEYEANKRSDQAKADKRKWWFNQREPIDRFTGWLVAWTALLFIATIASTIVLLVTDSTFKAQLAEMRSASEQTNRLIAANEKLANATETAGRAWLAITRFSFVDLKDASEPLKVSVFYQDVGKEPATNVRNRYFAGYIVKPSLPPEHWSDLSAWRDDKAGLTGKAMCSKIDPASSATVVYPSPNFGFAITISKGDQNERDYPDSAIPELFEMVKSKSAIYFVGGCLSYETLKQQKFSTFCAYLNPIEGKDISTWQFSACPVGNDDF